jgi:tetratricopeptide (TPR) repeat protein
MWIHNREVRLMLGNRVWILTLAMCALAGCGLASRGSLLKTQQAYTESKYDQCIARAEEGIGYESDNPATNAALYFYKARCLELARRVPEAMAIYERLIAKFPDSDYALQAAERLRELRTPSPV